MVIDYCRLAAQATRECEFESPLEILTPCSLALGNPRTAADRERARRLGEANFVSERKSTFGPGDRLGVNPPPVPNPSHRYVRFDQL